MLYMEEKKTLFRQEKSSLGLIMDKFKWFYGLSLKLDKFFKIIHPRNILYMETTILKLLNLVINIFLMNVISNR